MEEDKQDTQQEIQDVEEQPSDESPPAHHGPHHVAEDDIFPLIGIHKKDEDSEEEDGETSQILGSKKRLDLASLEESKNNEKPDGTPKSIAKLSADFSEEDSIREHAYNYFIFTLAGKPIFCRFGDEFHLSPMFATFSALIPKILSFYSDNPFYQNRNFLRCIRAKNIK